MTKKDSIKKLIGSMEEILTKIDGKIKIIEDRPSGQYKIAICSLPRTEIVIRSLIYEIKQFFPETVSPLERPYPLKCTNEEILLDIKEQFKEIVRTAKELYDN